jgi:hypothetical protein
MAKRDLKNLLAQRTATGEDQPVKSIDVGAKTASGNGAAADLKNYESAVMLIDADAWTDGTHTIHLEESADNSTFTDVAAADLVFNANIGAINASGNVVIDGATDDDQAYIVGYTGNQRYIRIAATVTSASTGAIYGGIILRGHPRHLGANLMA